MSYFFINHSRNNYLTINDFFITWVSNKMCEYFKSKSIRSHTMSKQLWTGTINNIIQTIFLYSKLNVLAYIILCFIIEKRNMLVEGTCILSFSTKQLVISWMTLFGNYLKLFINSVMRLFLQLYLYKRLICFTQCICLIIRQIHVFTNKTQIILLASFWLFNLIMKETFKKI